MDDFIEQGERRLPKIQLYHVSPYKISNTDALRPRDLEEGPAGELWLLEGSPDYSYGEYAYEVDGHISRVDSSPSGDHQVFLELQDGSVISFVKHGHAYRTKASIPATAVTACRLPAKGTSDYYYKKYGAIDDE